MKQKIVSFLLIVVFLLTISLGSNIVRVRVLAVGPDLYIKDTPSDTGVEPNPNPGAMYVSEDIWVRNEPDPGYQPFPFTTGSPPWTPLAHQNPEYRDPKYSKPNYVYIRINNRGDAASSGTEMLRVFWAKAGTGLGWPTQWGGGTWTHEVDYTSNTCGPSRLYGSEVTKPRKNAASVTATERDAYSAAIFGIGTTHPQFDFPGGVTYWHKQQEVHVDPTTVSKHLTPQFTPWHREFNNRYEALLQEKNPSIKLLYWDWTTVPAAGTFYTSTFMGASGSGAGGPVSIGSPFNPAAGTTLAPPAVTRDLGGAASQPNPITATDTTLLGFSNYATNAGFRRHMEFDAHNGSHVYLGGNGGEMSFPAVSTKDPFFFLLHANADRIWAMWQRNVSNLGRLDPATTYSTESVNADITKLMGPWDGSSGIRPWTVGDGYIVNKTSMDPSVVSPPIYDTAPLVVPVLQPGESVVLQIPWYPPNPADFSSGGCDQGHFCLLSRIETSSSSPFGMAFLEGTNVGTNTRNNNNIAWKNLTVVDDFAGAFKLSSIIAQNIFREPVLWGLRLADIKEARTSFFDVGRIVVDLPPELLKRWREQNPDPKGMGIFRDKDGREKIQITSREAAIQNVKLGPGEAFPVTIQFELSKDYKVEPGQKLKWDIVQTGAPGKPDEIVGGQRFEIDLSKLTLIKKGSEWRYFTGANKGNRWTEPGFEDSKWKTGRGELGYGDDPETTIDGGPAGKRPVTTYFRKAFEVGDPGFIRDLILRLKRDDGGIVYLNGKEIHRVNLPGGAITAATLASKDVKGLEEEAFFPVKVDPKLLREGQNVIAVELHQVSPRTEDASFDLELTANNVLPLLAPNAAFRSVTNGSLWQRGQVIPVNLETLDTDGKVSGVAFFLDGKEISRGDKPPFGLQLKDVAVGTHRLKVVVVDDDQQETVREMTITVLENTPPLVRLIEPANMKAFMPGSVIRAVAEASDPGGKVQRVEFFLSSMAIFNAPMELVGTATAPPYTVTVRGIKPGVYMLHAFAIDDRGASQQASPVHITIGRMDH